MEPNLESRLENIESTLVDITETLDSINETFKRITNREASMKPAYGRYDWNTGEPISETYIFRNNPDEVKTTNRIQFDWSSDNTLRNGI